MKKTAIVLGLFLAILCMACAQAEVCIDFGDGDPTNGTWNEALSKIETPFMYPELLEGLDERDAKSFIKELMLLGYTEEQLYEPLRYGWSADYSTYISEDGYVPIYLRDYVPGEVYRVAAFYKAQNGENHCAYYIIPTREPEEGVDFIEGIHLDVAFKTGMYRDIGIVISGAGEIYVHELDVVVAHDCGGWSRGLTKGLPQPGSEQCLYTAGSSGTYDINVQENLNQLQPESFAIGWPEDGSVHTGYDGVEQFSDSIAIEIDKGVDIGPGQGITMTLTELKTGEVVVNAYEPEPHLVDFGDRWVFWGNNMFERPFVLPEAWNPGDYRLTCEISGIGAVSVDLVLEKESVDPVETYRKFMNGEPRFIFRRDTENANWIGNWNADFSVYETDDEGFMSVVTTGLTPGEAYQCALFYTEEQGELHKSVETVINADGDLDSEQTTLFKISNLKGMYKGFTLMLAGKDAELYHTFDCEVPETVRDEPDGIVHESETTWFTAMWDDGSKQGNYAIPETGFAIHQPQAGAYAGTGDSRLNIVLSFSTQVPGQFKIELSLTDRTTGETVALARETYAQLGGGTWSFGGELPLPEDLASGDYTLTVKALGEQHTVDMSLQVTDVVEKYLAHSGGK